MELMMRKAVIVGGTGQIGLAVSQRLIDEGWDVTVVSRDSKALPFDCRHLESDSRDVEKLCALFGPNTDLLLSCVAFDSADANCLARAGRNTGRIVVISSGSVYRDEKGRTLDEASVCGFPALPVPITVNCPTVAPGPINYSTRKVAMEKTLLDDAKCPVTILRPWAIHGPKSKHAREWWFVKRLLDGRKAIPLAYRGLSRFQTTSVAAIANAVLQAHSGDLAVVENVTDADCPTVVEIARAIMNAMSVKAELVGLPHVSTYPPELGATPWSIPQPIVGQSEVTANATYSQTVGPTVKWLTEEIQIDKWRDLLPQFAGYPYQHFDYHADERALLLPDAALLES
jgi:nucleoside-diphosphate-sugar epimerase